MVHTKETVQRTVQHALDKGADPEATFEAAARLFGIPAEQVREVMDEAKEPQA